MVVFLFNTVICVFWCRIHLWFRLMGGLQAKSITSQRYRAVTNGGYVLLWQRYDNNKMVAMHYYGNVMTTTMSQHSDDVFYIFNSTVIDWTCFYCYVHVILFFDYPDWCFSVIFPQLYSNAGVSLAKTGHGSHPSKIFVLFYVCLFCVVLCIVCV